MGINKINNNKNRQQGFSLIQVVVAASMMSFLGLAMSNVVEQAYIAQNSISFKDNIRQFSEELKYSIESEEDCKKAFKITNTLASNLNILDQNLNMNLNIPGKNAVKQDATFHNFEMSVGALFLDNVNRLSDSGTNRVYQAQLKLRPIPIKKTLYNGGVRDENVAVLKFLTNASGQVISCSADGDLSDNGGNNPEEELTGATAPCTAPTKGHGQVRVDFEERGNLQYGGFVCRKSFICAAGKWVPLETSIHRGRLLCNWDERIVGCECTGGDNSR